MKPYNCVATGDEIGMLEIVLEAETVANIQRDFGGARGAFKVPMPTLSSAADLRAGGADAGLVPEE